MSHLSCAIRCKYVYRLKRPVLVCKKNIVIFEGSNSIKQLAVNLKIGKNEESIHKGYVEYAEYCKSYINEDKLDFTKKVTMTAHSLGSVAAVLTAQEWTKEKGINVDLVLFGSPKPGGQKFVNEVNNNEKIKIYNYVNRWDPVQFFPCVYDYFHVGDQITLEHETHSNPIRNHQIECYIRNMKEYCSEDDYCISELYI